MIDPLDLASLAAKERFLRYEQTAWRVLYLDECSKRMKLGELAQERLAQSRAEIAVACGLHRE